VTAPADEYVTFIQHQLPGLDDGSYELQVSQHVDDAAGKAISGDTLSRRYGFAITGDRFRLRNPGASIASTFPAPNATGEFTTVLPHVVFTNTSLPWARSPTPAAPARSALHAQTEADVPTWLAVLMLDDDDVVAYPGLDLTPVTRVLGDLFPTSELGSNHSYFDGATDTGALEIDETAKDPVQTIDIPLALFSAIAPTLEDLELSAHVRRLSVANKPVDAGQEPQADPIGTFSIVVGTRLPQPDKRSYAYLVSLEGLERFLPGSANPVADTSGFLRLAVLHHWTFNTKGETAAFVDQLKQLNQPAEPGDPPNTNLRLWMKEAKPPISTALEAGYVPLDHDLRTAESTVSWYRGPLSPMDADPPAIDLPISSPDQALVFDPTTGLFDASLAAAWTIGRLAALQDKSYAASLYAWKKGLVRAVVDKAERKIIDDVLGGLFSVSANLEGPPRPDAQPLLHNTMQLLQTSNGVASESDEAPEPDGADASPPGELFSRVRREQEIDAAFAEPNSEAISLAVLDVEVPDDVAAWLGRLNALIGVPFGYLVPDEAMLPPESIRFFRLDETWTKALLDGAFSLGRNLSAEAASPTANVDSAVFDAVNAEAREAAPERMLTGDVRAATAATRWTGFMLRSRVVTAYPGLGVNVYPKGATPDNPAPELLPIVRLERLGPNGDTLLCLVKGDIYRADVHEAPELLHYGIDDYKPGTPSPTASKNVRTFKRGADDSITFGDFDQVPIGASFRSGSPRVLDLPALAKLIGAADAAEMGFAMTEGVGMVSFVREDSG
jgi:hypothetical protein